MLPTEERIKELREHFGVWNGQFFAEYRFKNLNWYLGKKIPIKFEECEWFCYGDVRHDDIARVQSLLKSDELLFLGWKELGANQEWDSVFRDGEGPWVIITNPSVLLDIRRDIHVKCENPECPKNGRCRGLCAINF